MTSISSYIGTSATENVVRAIERAKANEKFNALLSLTEERALERAAIIDADPSKGKLAGVPFVVKDNFLAFGAPTTAASKFLEHFDAPLQATVIKRLEAEGAICIGKANLDAFAHGGSTENSAYGPTKNAYDDTRVAGGSSGGSAVVIALDIVPFALGTDTGGSIRQPASFNGVVGLKPTYGMVSRFGVVAMASGTDSIGCFASSSDDAALVASIMAGRDECDPTTLPDYFVPSRIEAPKKIGVIRELMSEGVDEEVTQRVQEQIDALTEKGHVIELVDMPIIKHSLAMYYIIVPAEISSNLARYDGVRYGARSDNAKTLTEVYTASRADGFVLENKRRILIGSFVLSSGFYDAYYIKAQKARTLLIRAFESLFEQYDFLLSPVAPTPAFRLGQNVDDPVKMYLEDAMTVPASLAGLPAVSVPAGLSGEGLPIGLQIIGPAKSDAEVLALAGVVEANNG